MRKHCPIHGKILVIGITDIDDSVVEVWKCTKIIDFETMKHCEYAEDLTVELKDGKLYRK